MSTLALILLMCVTSSMAGYLRIPVELENTIAVGSSTTDYPPWKDLLAQASCTALADGGKYIFAVRRRCKSPAKTCTDICADASLKAQDSTMALQTATCVNALHVYTRDFLDNNYANDLETLGLKVYRFNNCGDKNRGPNHCCCRMGYEPSS